MPSTVELNSKLRVISSQFTARCAYACVLKVPKPFSDLLLFIHDSRARLTVASPLPKQGPLMWARIKKGMTSRLQKGQTKRGVLTPLISLFTPNAEFPCEQDGFSGSLWGNCENRMVDIAIDFEAVLQNFLSFFFTVCVHLLLFLALNSS